MRRSSVSSIVCWSGGYHRSGKVIRSLSSSLFSGNPDLIFTELIPLIRFAFSNRAVLHVFLKGYNRLIYMNGSVFESMDLNLPDITSQLLRCIFSAVRNSWQICFSHKKIFFFSWPLQNDLNRCQNRKRTNLKGEVWENGNILVYWMRKGEWTLKIEQRGHSFINHPAVLRITEVATLSNAPEFLKWNPSPMMSLRRSTSAAASLFVHLQVSVSVLTGFAPMTCWPPAASSLDQQILNQSVNAPLHRTDCCREPFARQHSATSTNTM